MEIKFRKLISSMMMLLIKSIINFNTKNKVKRINKLIFLLSPVKIKDFNSLTNPNLKHMRKRKVLANRTKAD